MPAVTKISSSWASWSLVTELLARSRASTWAAPMSPRFQAAAATGRPEQGLAPAQLGPGLFFGEMAERVDPRRGGEGPVGEEGPPLVERRHGARQVAHSPRDIWRSSPLIVAGSQ